MGGEGKRERERVGGESGREGRGEGRDKRNACISM